MKEMLGIFLGSALVSFIISGIIWALIGFIGWDWSVAQWPPLNRGLLVFLSLGGFVAWVAFGARK